METHEQEVGDIIADAHKVIADLPQTDEEVVTDGTSSLERHVASDEIIQGISTILFMSSKPLTIPKIRSLLQEADESLVKLDVKTVRQLLLELKASLEMLPLGFEIVEVAMGWQLRTKPKCGRFISKEVRNQTIKLTPTSLEVLSLIAYRQPISKPEIDEMRGVDTSHIIRLLMDKNLVKITGRAETVGKPALYGTTPDFLELIGLADLSALPSRTEIESMVPENVAGGDIEQEQVDNIKRLVNERRPQYLDQIDNQEAQDEEFLLNLRQELDAIETSTQTIDQERQIMRVRLNFEKKKAAKRRELMDQGMEEAEIDSALALNGFAPQDLDQLIAQLQQPELSTGGNTQ